jgi:UDP-3-O-[3-hydroxymyristoyl] glucosamine N-acyltransferase
VQLLNEFEVMGFVDDGAYIRGECVSGFSVLGPAKNFESYLNIAKHAIVAIGNNALREALSIQVASAGFNLINVIHPRAVVSVSAHLGVGNVVMAGAVVGTGATLGNGVIVNSGAVIDHDAHAHNFSHLGVNACMAGASVLGALAHLSAGSVVGTNASVPSCVTHSRKDVV